MIRNGPKKIIFSSGKHGLLQMISNPINERCETLVRVGLDFLHGRHVLKLPGRAPKKKAQKKTIASLGCYTSKNEKKLKGFSFKEKSQTNVGWRLENQTLQSYR